jgi:hypothetical protein
VNTALHYMLIAHALPWGLISSRLPPVSDQEGKPEWCSTFISTSTVCLLCSYLVAPCWITLMSISTVCLLCLYLTAPYWITLVSTVSHCVHTRLHHTGSTYTGKDKTSVKKSERAERTSLNPIETLSLPLEACAALSVDCAHTVLRLHQSSCT